MLCMHHVLAAVERRYAAGTMRQMVRSLANLVQRHWCDYVSFLSLWGKETKEVRGGGVRSQYTPLWNPPVAPYIDAVKSYPCSRYRLTKNGHGTNTVELHHTLVPRFLQSPSAPSE